MIPTLDLRNAKEVVSVWGTGDWHVGSNRFDATLFEKHFTRAVKEGWHLVHVGDALEMVTPGSKVAGRGALRDQIIPPEEQRQLLISRLKQLRAPGFILGGNHEYRVDAATGLDFIKTVTDAVGENITPLELPGRVRFLVGKQTYDLYIHHGEGPVVSPTTLFDRIQRDEEGLDAILCGHIHSSTSDPAEVGTANGDRIILRLRTGHYLKNPRYVLVRPLARRGARGSWLLELHPTEHIIEATWLS